MLTKLIIKNFKRFEEVEIELGNRVKKDLIPPVALRDYQDPWWINTKTSEFLDRLFDLYFRRLGIPNIMQKTNYHLLARLVPPNLLEPEIAEKLDAIFEVANQAKPAEGENL